MNRVKHCLNKMNELVNHPGSKDVIDLDLLLDYTKIIYAEVLEQRDNMLANKTSRDAVMRYKNEETTTRQQPRETSPPLAPDPTPPPAPEPSPTVEPSKPKPQEKTTAPPKELKTVGINFENPNAQSQSIPAPDPSLYDLRKLISLNDKFAYVIELYNGNNEEYEDAINTLNKIGTYGNSMEWIISNLQNKYNWNVESDLVQKFYEVVKSRFERNA